MNWNDEQIEAASQSRQRMKQLETSMNIDGETYLCAREVARRAGFSLQRLNQLRTQQNIPALRTEWGFYYCERDVTPLFDPQRDRKGGRPHNLRVGRPTKAIEQQ